MGHYLTNSHEGPFYYTTLSLFKKSKGQEHINDNYLKIYICNMLAMNIEEILIENEQLKAENIELKRKLETYSNPQKSYYERNKEVVNQKAKERMKKISQENPDKLKEINRKAYLKRKEKILVKQNENI